MANMIKITTCELEGNARNIEKKMNIIREETLSLKQSIDDLSSRWGGLSTILEESRLENEIYPILLERFPDLIQQIIKEIDNGVSSFNEKNEMISDLFKA